jgi:surface protein
VDYRQMDSVNPLNDSALVVPSGTWGSGPPGGSAAGDEGPANDVICPGVPHVGLPVGTRVIVDGAVGHYVGLKLPAFGRVEHEIHFDEGGRKTLRGDRCRFFGVVWAYLSFGLVCYSQRGRGWSIDDDNDYQVVARRVLSTQSRTPNADGAKVRSGISIKAVHTRTLEPGTIVSVLEQGKCDGHHRGRISPTEWVSITTARGSVLLAPGAGVVTVSTITAPNGADVQITAQTTLAELKHGISEALGIPAAEQQLQLIEHEGRSDMTVEGAESQFLWEVGVRQGMRVLVVAVPAAPPDARARAYGTAIATLDVPWNWRLDLAGMSLVLWTVAVFLPWNVVPGLVTHSGRSLFGLAWCGATVWIFVGFYQVLLCLGCYVHRKTYNTRLTHEMRAWAVGGGRNDPRHPVFGEFSQVSGCARMLAFALAAWGPLLYLLYLAVRGPFPVPMTNESLRAAVVACHAESATFDCPTAERCHAGGYPIGDWDTSSVTNMHSLFAEAAHFDQPIGDWDTSSVTNMHSLFQGAARFDQPIGDWDTSSVTDMFALFAEAARFDQPIGDWDTSSVTDMVALFAEATPFLHPLSDWDTSSVTNMRSLFQGAARFDQPIGDWDTSSVTDMGGLFSGATSFRHDVSGWDVGAVANMRNMFGGACPLMCPAQWCRPDFNARMLRLQHQCSPC